MTSEEARIVGAIMLTADGGCAPCARALINELVKDFPEHREAFAIAFWAEYESDPYR